jgi:hypothetical protein
MDATNIKIVEHENGLVTQGLTPELDSVSSANLRMSSMTRHIASGDGHLASSHNKRELIGGWRDNTQFCAICLRARIYALGT